MKLKYSFRDNTIYTRKYKMDRAWYIYDNGKRIVKAYQMGQSEYQEKYKGNLYCCGEECPAKMVLVEQQKKEYMRYFRRLQGSKHREDCPYNSGEAANGGNGTRGDKVIVELSERHAKDVLSGAYNVAIGKKKPKRAKSNNNKNNNRKVDKKNKKKEVVKSVLLPGKRSKGNNGIRQPTIYKKSVSDILICKNNETYCVYGEVKCINIKDDEASIIIEDKSEKTFDIYFGNAFKINNEQDFKYLKFFKEYCEICISKGEKAICTCICFKKVMGKNTIGEILDIDWIRINDKGLNKIGNILRYKDK